MSPGLFFRLGLFLRGRREEKQPRAHFSPARHLFLLALAIVPLIHVSQPLREVQKYYAVIGAAFIPLLAVVLLIVNGRRNWVGEHRNRLTTVVVLAVTLVFFVAAGALHVRLRWS